MNGFASSHHKESHSWSEINFDEPQCPQKLEGMLLKSDIGDLEEISDKLKRRIEKLEGTLSLTGVLMTDNSAERKMADTPLTRTEMVW